MGYLEYPKGENSIILRIGIRLYAIHLLERESGIPNWTYRIRFSNLKYYSELFFNSLNFAVIVGFPLVNFLIVRSSALLFAKRRLFSEESSASFVF